MRVGWIGLGAMGAPMVLRILERGHEVQAFDVVPAAVTLACGEGAVAARSPRDAARGADVLVVMVATAEQVEEVLFGPDGAEAALEPGGCVMMMSTVGDGVVPGWCDRLAQRGVDLVDAPVSGGAARARTGDLLVMVSGAASAVEGVRPLLDDLARDAPVVGEEPGAGQRIKLVNQLLCGVHIAAAAEALSFAEAMGLDPARVLEVIRQGAAGSFMLDDRGRRMLETDPVVASRVDIFVKDMGLVASAAEQLGFSASLAASAQSRFREASKRGWGSSDDSRVINVYRGKGL